MNELQLGWIDFSKEQRNKVIRVINLLSEPEAVDDVFVNRKLYHISIENWAS
jgi:hypothetical protein